MNLTLKKTVLSIAIAASVTASLPASAAGEIYDFSFSGLFTILGPSSNKVIQNTSNPYYSDPTWGYGKRTPVTGTLHFDTGTGAGSGTIAPFDFLATGPMAFHSLSFQAIGNGTGGPGSLVLSNMLFDWNYEHGLPVSIVMDAQGLFGAMQAAGGALTVGQTVSGTYGVLGASDGIYSGQIKMGNLPIASTSWNTTSGSLPLIADSIGGSPMIGGPFKDYSVNFDVQSLKVTAVTSVPVPAAAWLFGSGMVGLFGIARRRNMPV